MILYGIKNCDTVKKARKWLEANGVDYQFHDFRADGIDAAAIQGWLNTVGADKLINKRGTTWRKLSAADQARAETDPAGLLAEHEAVIKRPMIVADGYCDCGFGKAEQAALAAHLGIDA